MFFQGECDNNTIYGKLNHYNLITKRLKFEVKLKLKQKENLS